MNILNKTVLGKFFFFLVSLTTMFSIGFKETIGIRIVFIVVFSSMFLTFMSYTYDRLTNSKQL